MTTIDSTNVAECTSVLIAEDQEYLREGISNILATQPGITLLGAAADGLAAYEMALDLSPQVLLLDIHMPGLNGLAVAERIRTQCPEIGLLALSQYDDLTYVQSFLGDEPRRKGYLLKSTLGQIASLTRAIRAVAAGHLVLDPQLAAQLLQDSTTTLSELTQQEKRVLAAMAQGLGNQGIADLLTIEKTTVENHINSIYSKLAVGPQPERHRRVDAVLRFLNANRRNGNHRTQFSPPGNIGITCDQAPGEMSSPALPNDVDTGCQKSPDSTAKPIGPIQQKECGMLAYQRRKLT
jgi:DNA-binding NarL/FixJ family response regulator